MNSIEEGKSLPVKPMVSIITVVYNGMHVLEGTIQSVLDQTYENFEYLIIDGGSTDGTLHLIEKYNDNIDFWVSEPDEGIYHAMNKAIDRANGEWIIFMNAGDVFYSSNVLDIVNDANADVVYGDALVQYPTFTANWRKLRIVDFWKGLPFCHQACFVKTSLMKEHKFSLKYKLSSDFDFLYKLYITGGSFLYRPTIVCLYDFTTGASVTHNFASLNERKMSVLSYGYSFRKWIFYTWLAIYTRLSFLFKVFAGKKITGWITRLLRR